MIKNIFKKAIQIVKPKGITVNTGKINVKAKETRRWFKTNNKEIKVVKRNGKTNNYTVFLNKNKTKILQLSAFGKEITKHPEIITFIENNIFENKKKGGDKFENNKLNLFLKNINREHAYNSNQWLNLIIEFKEKNENRNLFIKIAENKKYLANNEFIANNAFEKYGINVLKPHFAYTDLAKKRSVIAYDFTNMNTLYFYKKKGLLTTLEIKEIYKKIKKLEKHRLPLTSDKKKGIADYNNETNIFVKKNNEKIDLYFSDLIID